MKVFTMWAVAITAAGLLVSTAFAGGDPARGKALFDDPKLAGARAGKSCAACHPGGSLIGFSAAKKNYTVMGRRVGRLEDAVNVCIEGRMKGRRLAPKSPDLADITVYIRSLKEKAAVVPPQKRTAATGC